ncbi:acyltransferase family protein [Flavimobilis sp. GY10621]|uniref:Acyltransferase family protein n=1 Tax=Flavimobilis rhizosphaerae TaxID=2775421 RepID=A0ABR9DL46_9MICO|nr:acyltransferase [Flavimobilis rhizosphaerae]MBD9697894.1 acyltransferase family protein [Flavimobilis rhizosphaerae]
MTDTTPEARTLPADTAPADLARDRFADLVRSVALGAVICGHWTMAAVSVDAGGALHVGNVLARARWAWPATWVLVLIGLFFLVGGFANATSLTRARARGLSSRAWVGRRLRGLFGPVVPFVALVLAVVGIALLVGAPRGLTATVAVAVLMPLWFLAVYGVLVVLAPLGLRLDARWGWRVWIVMSVGAVAVDAVRIVTDVPWYGYLNYVLVWGLAQQLGFAYRDGRLTRVRAPALALWAAAGFGTMALLASTGEWSWSMVGLPGDRSPMNPPSTQALAHVWAQVPLALLARRALAGRLDGPRAAPLLDRVADASLRAFLWHLPLYVVVTAVWFAAGWPFPEPASGLWWATRPLVLVVLGALLVVLLGLPARLRRRRAPAA